MKIGKHAVETAGTTKAQGVSNGSLELRQGIIRGFRQTELEWKSAGQFSAAGYFSPIQIVVDGTEYEAFVRSTEKMAGKPAPRSREAGEAVVMRDVRTGSWTREFSIARVSQASVIGTGAGRGDGITTADQGYFRGHQGPGADSTADSKYVGGGDQANARSTLYDNLTLSGKANVAQTPPTGLSEVALNLNAKVRLARVADRVFDTDDRGDDGRSFYLPNPGQVQKLIELGKAQGSLGPDFQLEGASQRMVAFVHGGDEPLLCIALQSRRDGSLSCRLPVINLVDFVKNDDFGTRGVAVSTYAQVLGTTDDLDPFEKLARLLADTPGHPVDDDARLHFWR